MDRISRCMQVAEGFGLGGQILSLLFAYDVVLLASLNRYLEVSLGQFAAECEVAGMRISTAASHGQI